MPCFVSENKRGIQRFKCDLCAMPSIPQNKQKASLQSGSGLNSGYPPAQLSFLLPDQICGNCLCSVTKQSSLRFYGCLCLSGDHGVDSHCHRKLHTVTGSYRPVGLWSCFRPLHTILLQLYHRISRKYAVITQLMRSMMAELPSDFVTPELMEKKNFLIRTT